MKIDLDNLLAQAGLPAPKRDVPRPAAYALFAKPAASKAPNQIGPNWAEPALDHIRATDPDILQAETVSYALTQMSTRLRDPACYDFYADILTLANNPMALYSTNIAVTDLATARFSSEFKIFRKNFVYFHKKAKPQQRYFKIYILLAMVERENYLTACASGAANPTLDTTMMNYAKGLSPHHPWAIGESIATDMLVRPDFDAGKALRKLDRALETNPTEQYLHAIRCSVLEKHGSTEDLVKALAAFRQHHPDDPEIPLYELTILNRQVNTDATRAAELYVDEHERDKLAFEEETAWNQKEAADQLAAEEKHAWQQKAEEEAQISAEEASAWQEKKLADTERKATLLEIADAADMAKDRTNAVLTYQQYLRFAPNDYHAMARLANIQCYGPSARYGAMLAHTAFDGMHGSKKPHHITKYDPITTFSLAMSLLYRHHLSSAKDLIHRAYSSDPSDQIFVFLNAECDWQHSRILEDEQKRFSLGARASRKLGHITAKPLNPDYAFMHHLVLINAVIRNKDLTSNATTIAEDPNLFIDRGLQAYQIDPVIVAGNRGASLAAAQLLQKRYAREKMNQNRPLESAVRRAQYDVLAPGIITDLAQGRVFLTGIKRYDLFVRTCARLDMLDAHHGRPVNTDRASLVERLEHALVANNIEISRDYLTVGDIAEPQPVRPVRRFSRPRYAYDLDD